MKKGFLILLFVLFFSLFFSFSNIYGNNYKEESRGYKVLAVLCPDSNYTIQDFFNEVPCNTSDSDYEKRYKRLEEEYNKLRERLKNQEAHNTGKWILTRAGKISACDRKK